jgi:hypothetical protein
MSDIKTISWRLNVTRVRRGARIIAGIGVSGGGRTQRHNISPCCNSLILGTKQPIFVRPPFQEIILGQPAVLIGLTAHIAKTHYASFAAAGSRHSRHLRGSDRHHRATQRSCPMTSAAAGLSEAAFAHVIVASRAASAEANERCKCATSGSWPVKSRNASTAVCTHMPEPLSTRAPRAAAAFKNMVSIGV